MYFNLAYAFHYSPDIIDNMKVYMLVILDRRARKAGIFGEKEEKSSGTTQDFGKIFGTEVRLED